MKLKRHTFGVVLLALLLCINAYATYRAARYVSVVKKYNSEVRGIALQVTSLSTNLLASLNLETPSSSSVSSDDSGVSFLGSIPFRYTVVRGVSGITSGGASWHPVGSETPYGRLSSCSRDFACFDGLNWYSLGYD